MPSQRPSRRLIIAALVIVLVKLLMMITLVHLHWSGRVIAVVGMIFVGLVIMVRFVVLVIMADRLEWLSVWAALHVAFVFDHEVLVQALSFGTALAVVAIVGVKRWNRTRRQSLAQETQPHPAPNPQNLTPAQAPSQGSRVIRELPARQE